MRKGPLVMVRLAPIPRDIRQVPTLRTQAVRKGAAAPVVKDGHPYKVPLATRWFYLVCCDCRLAHDMRFDVRGRWLVIRAARAGKAKRRGRVL